MDNLSLCVATCGLQGANLRRDWRSTFSFLSFSIYCLALAFEHYRQVYIVHSGLGITIFRHCVRHDLSPSCLERVSSDTYKKVKSWNISSLYLSADIVGTIPLVCGLIDWLIDWMIDYSFKFFVWWCVQFVWMSLCLFVCVWIRLLAKYNLIACRIARILLHSAVF